jgi:hypothetical protein
VNAILECNRKWGLKFKIRFVFFNSPKLVALDVGSQMEPLMDVVMEFACQDDGQCVGSFEREMGAVAACEGFH